jgi:hypothetical protein
LTENVHIYCLSRGSQEQTWCSDCVQTYWQDLKSEGWTADDETWSELGFDDGKESEEEDESEEESEDEKPAPKISVNFKNAMRMEDEYNAMEKAKEQ